MKRSIVTVNVFNIVWNDEDYYKYNEDGIELADSINNVALEVVYDKLDTFYSAVEDKIAEYLTNEYAIEVESFDWEFVCEEEHDM